MHKVAMSKWGKISIEVNCDTNSGCNDFNFFSLSLIKFRVSADIDSWSNIDISIGAKSGIFHIEQV